MLLAIETATDTCSAALWVDGAVLVDFSLHKPRKHAEELAPMIKELLLKADARAANLDAVAVSMGPGSYTGLRIGVSTAKGIAMASEAELVGVDTLAAIAESVAPYAAEGNVISPLLDSRRDEMFAAAYRAGDGLEEIAAPTACTVDEWADALPRFAADAPALWLAGDGIHKASERAHDIFPGSAYILDPNVHPLSARWVAHVGARQFEVGHVEDLANFEPHYLKDFVPGKPKKSPFENIPDAQK